MHFIVNLLNFVGIAGLAYVDQTYMNFSSDSCLPKVTLMLYSYGLSIVLLIECTEQYTLLWFVLEMHEFAAAQKNYEISHVSHPFQCQ